MSAQPAQPLDVDVDEAADGDAAAAFLARVLAEVRAAEAAAKAARARAQAASDRVRRLQREARNG